MFWEKESTSTVAKLATSYSVTEPSVCGNCDNISFHKTEQTVTHNQRRNAKKKMQKYKKLTLKTKLVGSKTHKNLNQTG